MAVILGRSALYVWWMVMLFVVAILYRLGKKRLASSQSLKVISKPRYRHKVGCVLHAISSPTIVRDEFEREDFSTRPAKLYQGPGSSRWDDT
jgi:hypothetical protein